MHRDSRHWWWQRPFLYIGRMAEDKGVLLILKAWGELRSHFGDTCPSLWLVGGFPAEIDAMRALVGWQEPLVEYEQKGEIVWWGYLDPAGISALLCRSGVVVTHSRYEPGGRVVLEAMAQGVPVIATPHGFAADLVEDWKTGFLVEFGQHRDLVTRMSHFVRQPLLRNVLGADARRAAMHVLDRWDFMETHCAAYEDAVAARKTAPRSRPGIGRAPDLSQYASRRVPATYPLNDIEPSEEMVRALVEESTGELVRHLEVISSGPGSSLRWRAQSADAAWIVKWPYPRLNRSVLWEFRCAPLLSTGEARFARDWFSGSLPGFVSWAGADPDSRLLLRRELPRLQECSHKTLALAAETYGKLATAAFSAGNLADILRRDWRQTSRSQMMEAIQAIKAELNGEIWDDGRHFSLGMAWRMTELQIRSTPSVIGLPIPDEVMQSISLFTGLAESELSLPVTVAHGSGDPSHCLWMDDGSLGLIDGEHVHPALAGEDLAALVYEAALGYSPDPLDPDTWTSLLDAVAQDRDHRNRLLSWMGLLALTEVQKMAALLNRGGMQEAARTVQLLTRLIPTRR